MQEELNPIVYSKQVIEFVTVANEYCSFIEQAGAQTARQMLETSQKILPLIYLKVSLVPNVPEQEEESFVESFVSEIDYMYLQQRILNLLGEHDDYREVFAEGMAFSEEALTNSISEALLDIYQDLKNFIMNYRTADDFVMQESLWICIDNFKNIWGQSLVNVLRAIHSLVYSDIDFEQELKLKPEDEETPDKQMPNWLMGKYEEE